MSALPPEHASEETGERPPDDRPPGMPTWVKVFGIFGIVVVVVVVVVVIVLITGRGGHGPGRHSPSGGAGSRTPTATVAANSTPLS